MKDKQAALFVRINSDLKDLLDAAALAERRSTASLVELLLKKQIEANSEKTKRKSARQAGKSKGQILRAGSGS